MEKTTAQALIITHLMSGSDFDYRKIASALAAADPVLFCTLAGLAEERKVPALVDQAPAWAYDTFQLLVDGDVVPAIKTLRTGTGFGLKESKDIVDVFRRFSGFPQAGDLSPACYSALLLLQKAAGRQFL